MPRGGVCRKTRSSGGEFDTPPDRRVAAAAAAQHGVLSVRQLAACGLSHDAVLTRCRNGHLHRVHNGVYAVGHDGLTMHGRIMAAVLACGAGAVLSHLSAAALWGLVRWDDRHPEVTVHGSAARKRPELRIHRTRNLDPRDLARHQGIPVTAPARTLLDLAAVLPPRRLRRTVRQAQAEHRVNVRQIADVLARASGRRGATALGAIVADGPTPTRSELEDVVLDFLDLGGIVRPEVNPALVLAGRKVVPDFLWRDTRFVLEADGDAWHHGKLAREDDAERQAILGRTAIASSA